MNLIVGKFSLKAQPPTRFLNWFRIILFAVVPSHENLQ